MGNGRLKGRVKNFLYWIHKKVTGSSITQHNELYGIYRRIFYLYCTLTLSFIFIGDYLLDQYVMGVDTQIPGWIILSIEFWYFSLYLIGRYHYSQICNQILIGSMLVGIPIIFYFVPYSPSFLDYLIAPILLSAILLSNIGMYSSFGFSFLVIIIIDKIDPYQRIDNFPLLFDKLIFITLIFLCVILIDLYKNYVKNENLRIAMKQERLNAIAKVSGSIAHDFNNNLSIILNSAELFQYSENLTKEEERHLIEQIIKSATSSQLLTKQLLAQSKQYNAEYSAVKISEFLHKINHIIQQMIPPSINCKLLIEDSDDLVIVDTHSLEQIILNLVFNAKETIEANGGDTITIQYFSVNSKLINQFLQDKSIIAKNRYDELIAGFHDQYLVIAITDNSPKNEFNFENPSMDLTTDQIFTGIGLSIAYDIIERDYGIYASSTESGSSTFYCILPVILKITDHKTKPVKFDDVENQSSKKIMIIDDNEEIVNSMQRLILYLGYQVESFVCPKEALKYFKQHSKEVDLIVLDVLMPELNGVELFEKLIQIDDNPGVIFMSGFTQEVDLEQHLSNPRVKFIQKPVSFDDLRLYFNELLNTPK